jgi:hypothetical protein
LVHPGGKNGHIEFRLFLSNGSVVRVRRLNPTGNRLWLQVFGVVVRFVPRALHVPARLVGPDNQASIDDLLHGFWVESPDSFGVSLVNHPGLWVLDREELSRSRIFSHADSEVSARISPSLILVGVAVYTFFKPVKRGFVLGERINKDVLVVDG